MRCIAIVKSIENDQNKIPFTKSIRLKFVMIPGQVEAYAREITLRFVFRSVLTVKGVRF